MTKPRLHRLRFEALEDRITPTTLPNGMPILNSFPSAPAAIFMDFDGDTTTNVTPYDIDGDPTTFNTTEQAQITEAWRQLSGFFAMFNVNVTTVWPGASVPKAWLAIGNNISGGYSYVNVFPNSKPESFNQSSDARTRVTGLAHEVGHNFGLGHQKEFDSLGNKLVEYISAKEPLRGFLMGVDYSGTVRKWSIGHVANASSLQDDMAGIAAKLAVYGGDGYRPDDFSNTIAAATPLPVVGGVQTVTGIIERLTDVDAFSFTTAGGRLAITAAPDVPSGADLVLEIRNAANELLAVADTVNNGQTLHLQLPAGTYYALVSSKGNYADVGQYKLTVAEGSPAGFQSTNVGLMWHTGNTTFDAATGTWTVRGSGTDIASTSDQFQYVWQYLSGNGTITARVTGMDNTNATAKAGVMIRETLDANSRHASAVVPYTLTGRMIYRTSTGGSTSTAGGSSTTFAPRWVRITKSGNTITALQSTNGTTWTTISTQTVNVGTNFFVGLSVTSRNTGAVNASTFTDVSITGFSDPLAVTNPALAAPTNLVASPSNGNSLELTWSGSAAATGYSIERSDNGVTFLPVGSTSGATNWVDANPLGSQRYYYQVRALNTGGRSEPSATAEVVNRPSAVRSLRFISYTTTSIVLDWFDTDGETGYRIERSADGGQNWSQVGTVGRNVPSYTATGLTAATQYSFRVTPLSTLGDGTPAVTSGFTRLPAVAGLAFGTITPNSVQLNWNDIAGETGYRIDRSTDGTTFNTLTTLPANTTTFTNSGLSPETEYYYRVVGVVTGSESQSGTTMMAGTPAIQALPAPWIAADIGVPANARGMSSFSNGTFKAVSAGADIWGSSDQFRFTYQQLVGNGSITARVTAVENTGNWAKIGVMVRETLNANARHAHVFVSPGNGVNMQSRGSVGGSSQSNGSISGITAPYWVRMVRSGNTLTAFASPNGTTWTQVGSRTYSNLATTLFIGLSSNANTASLLNTSSWSNVSIYRNGVESVTVNDGGPQRSKVHSLTVAFNGLVNLPANPAQAFSVVRTGGGSQPFTVSLAGSTPTQTIATLHFASPLEDGRYTLTVLGSQVIDASGLGLGAMTGNHTEGFHRLFGDNNGDAAVDSIDFSSFGNSFGTSAGMPNFIAAYDFNDDGIIDATDFAEFGNRFGVSV